MDRCTLEQVLAEENVQEAISYVKKKKNRNSADYGEVLAFDEYWNMNGQTIRELIRTGKYEPDITRQYVELSKRGKKRNVSAMKTVDKVLCRALLQIISPYVEEQLSSRCFSYRKGMGTQHIVGFASKSIENHHIWVAEVDVQDFFDLYANKGKGTGGFEICN